MKIYVVHGNTGEYSDSTDWLVKAFYEEKQAAAFIKEANAIADKIWDEFNALRKSGDYGYTFLRNAIHPLDTKFQMDYTGTYYSYDETELT